YLRDVRITAIYEGTNGVQAMDLVGRKLAGDGGAAALSLTAEAAAVAERASGGPLAPLGKALGDAAAEAKALTRLLASAGEGDRGAAATPYLRVCALVLGGTALLRAALEDGGAEDLALAQFHIEQLLPAITGHAAAARAGAKSLYALDAEKLTATV
ncbi:MAG: acyl-CoA dehydrogenase, partial [Pseudomonadota bacterium]